MWAVITTKTFLKKLGSVRYTAKNGALHIAAVADDGVTVVEFNIEYPNVQAWVNNVDSRYIFYCEI